MIFRELVKNWVEPAGYSVRSPWKALAAPVPLQHSSSTARYLNVHSTLLVGPGQSAQRLGGPEEESNCRQEMMYMLRRALGSSAA